MHIRLKHQTSIENPLYFILEKLKNKVQKQIDCLLKTNIIRVTKDCRNSAPVFPIVNKNGTIKLVVDY